MHPLEDPAQQLSEIRKLLADLAVTLNARGVSVSSLGDMVCEMEQLRNLGDALRAELAAEAFAAGVPAQHGLRRIGDVVAAATNTRAGAVNRDLVYGEWVRGYPIFHVAALGGELTRDHLELFKKVDNPRTRQHLQNDQRYLADAARDLGFKQFEEVLGYWLLHVDPDGKEPAAQKEKRAASMRKERATGVLSGSFRFDAIDGAMVDTAVHQEMRRIQAEDHQLGITRTYDQRMADAFCRLIARGAARPDGTVPAPLLHLVMGVKTAQQLLDRKAAEANGEDVTGMTIHTDPHDPDYRCELVDGTPIHPLRAYDVLGEAVIRRLVLHPAERPGGPAKIADLSHAIRPQGDSLNANKLTRLLQETPSAALETSNRTYTPQLRDAVLAAGRGRCSTPTCNSSIHYLEIDHIHPHSRGGRSHTNNAQLLCAPENRQKHNQLPNPNTPPAGTRPNRK